MPVAEPDGLDRARSLRAEAVSENLAGRPRRAMATLSRALRLVPPPDQPATAAENAVRVACLLTLAVAEYQLGGLPAAQTRLDEARLLAGGEPELVARWRCQRGLILGRSGDLATAAAELAVVVEEPQWFTPLEQCTIRLNRGMVFQWLGRPGEAAAEFEAAAELARDGGDDRQAFMAQHNRGYALYLTGDLPGALATMAVADRMDADVFRGTALYDRGLVLHEAGLLDEAVAALDQARAACRPGQDRLLRAEVDMQRARTLLLAGEYAESAASARSARRRFRRLGMAGPAAQSDLIVRDADLATGRRLQQAATAAAEDERVAVDLGDPELRARAVVVAAEAAARLGRPEEARLALRRYPNASFGLVLNLRLAYATAVANLAAGRSPRRQLAAAASALAASQAASASLDSRAARKVLSLRLAQLDIDLAVQRGPTDVLTTLERWSSLGLPVVRPPADPRQAELTRRLRALSRVLREDPAGPEAAARRAESLRLRRELTGLSLAQRQEELGAAALVHASDALARIVAADRDLLWFFPHDGGLWGVAMIGGRRRLARLAELDRCLETTRRVQADLRAIAYQPAGPLRVAVAGSLTAGLAWLDETLVRPWRVRSPGLVVIGTHAVASVPWGGLPSLAGVPVTVASSATGWAGRRRTGAPHVEVLTGPGLDHAAAEAAAVAGAWPSAGLREAATSGELLAALGSAEVVHVAAHGLHRADSPLFSSLRMSDGDVYAHELPAGRVRAGHVVLSACDVGTAQVRPGDEPLGLADTLLALGVSSVVAAVAPVADAETAATMAAYHAGLAGGLPSDEALAAATSTGSAFVVLGSTWQAG
ncbi:MAG: CHAT domain-containing protein [Propionibacteriaceae bacterium]|nr:CHAT domain-containing protein [Propionibacteriaceae bacterium]